MAKQFNEEYWIAVYQSNIKEKFRMKVKGRSVKINGRLYFESRDHVFTDAYTGALIPSNHSPFQIPVELMEKEAQRLGSVMDLPCREQVEVDIDSKKIFDHVLSRSKSQTSTNLEV